MTQEQTLRNLLHAIERQRKLGYNEFGNPIDLVAVGELERMVRIKLAAEELHDRQYPEAIQ